MKLPVLKAVGTTFAFTIEHALDLLKIVWLPLALLTAISAFVLPGYMQTMMGVADLGAQPSPEDAMRAMSAALPAAFAMMIAGVAVYMIIFAGILKLVIRGEKPSMPFYIGFGSDEWRLLGTWLLCFLIFIGVEILAAIVAGLAGGLAFGAGGAGIYIAFAVGIVVLVAIIWVCIRLSLATPAAVGAQTIGIGPAWNASKGNVWPLFFYWLIWGVIFVIVEIGLIAILMPGYFEAMGSVFSAAGTGSPENVQAASRAMNEQMLAMYDTSSPMALIRLAGSLVIGTVLIVLVAVAGGVAWRLMTDAQPEKHFD